jgi:hypothetical protein
MFEVDYESVDDLLHRPFLEVVDYVQLVWENAMPDKKIFLIFHGIFICNLRYDLLVARIAFVPRCYASRFGAGAAIDGCLAPALHNFVMSHWTDMYEKSYMS